MSQSEALAVVVDQLLHDPELRPVLDTIAASSRSKAGSSWPVYAAAFRPGLVTCQQCIPALIHGTDPHHCDRCGETKTETCLMGSMQLGTMTWLFHICPSCSATIAEPTTEVVTAE